LDVNAELAQLAGTAREFLRVEYVWRLVDQVACRQHSVDDGGASAKRLAACGHVSHRNGNPGVQFIVLSVLVGLVAFEPIAPQQDACSEQSSLLRVHRLPRQLGDDRYRFACRIQFSGQYPSKPEKIPFLELGVPASSDHDQALNPDSLGFKDIEGGATL